MFRVALGNISINHWNKENLETPKTDLFLPLFRQTIGTRALATMLGVSLLLDTPSPAMPCDLSQHQGKQTAF